MAPALIPVGNVQSTIAVSGSGLDTVDFVTLRHFELGFTANATVLAASSSMVTFEFQESGWPAGSVQLLALSTGLVGSKLVVLNLFDPPNVTSITPTRTGIAGGSVITMSGDGFFPAMLRASITTDQISQVVDAVFIPGDSTIQIQMPQFPIPSSIDISEMALGEERVINATLRLSMNDGFDFDEEGASLGIVVSPLFKIGYLYNSPVSDFAWSYNWNLAQMEVASRHPQIVESEYVEAIAEEFYSTIPAGEQEAALVIRDYCKRNFDLVVACSFGFMNAAVYMSNEPVCNYWTDSEGNLTSIAKKTYLLHGGGVIQVRSF